MKVSLLIQYLEGFKQEFGDCEVDVVAEAIWNHEELIRHIVSMEESLPSQQGAGLQIETTCGDIAYDPSTKRIKVLGERF